MKLYDQNDVKELLQAIRENVQTIKGRPMIDLQYISDELDVLGYYDEEVEE
jgi:hypothetical protein